MAERRGGFVLVAAVLALTGLTLLLHGALLLARHEGRLARAGTELLQARGRAELGLVEAGAAGGGLPGGPVGSGDRIAEAGAGGSFRVDRIRLAREWWLLEAEGRDPEERVRARLRGVVWALDVPTRVAAFPAVVRLGPGATARGEDRIDGSSVRGPPGGRALSCHRWRAALDSLGVAGLPPVAVGSGPIPSLGLLAGDTLLGRIPVRVGGTGTPAPVRDRRGGCADDPWNWGDPRGGGGACGDRMVVRASAGDLEVRGGVGQGVWVVAGDLSLSGGAELRGLVLVGGRLELAGGAVLHGLAQAGEGVRVSDDSRIVGSACWAAAALEAARPALGGAFRDPAAPPYLRLPPR